MNRELAPAEDPLEQLARRLRERLLAEVTEASDGRDESATAAIDRLVAREAGVLPADTRALVADRLRVLAHGYGPLEPLLADQEVDEVMVNGPNEVWVERSGRLVRTGIAFASRDALLDVVERILAPLGRRVDEANPICDARLPDGSRVNVILPPLAVDGPCLTVRRFRKRGFALAELVELGTLPERVARELVAAVHERRSLLVSGGTGSGKTTLLAALCREIPPGERLITIEDAAELRLEREHVVRLEARPANLEGRGAVTIRELVRNALRMRPDRIVVGEVRGGEALDMLQAMNTGHEGSLSTIHANSPRDALRRLEVLALMADVDLPHAAVRAQLEAAIDVVVHMRRELGGRRVVSEVVELARDGALGCNTLWRRSRSAARAANGRERGSAAARATGGEGEGTDGERAGSGGLGGEL
ncbi:CpaF family protein [Thermoleophilum album]|uniref:CpaF family protein n=1 Tax=Thermoleophilum album TaxID=29539 RepID=UPI00237C61B5|nr:CpaF family protein [Thermoleophilum album]WDT94357.1 CpaF family protein [Thermoleophilum album]